MKKISLILASVAFVSIVLSSESYGIPAFSRKYKTSCATCHNGFPKMTAFGEAFRRNGYQFPGGTDAEFTKEEQVELGSEGNKKAFPDAIWPGSIPGTSPISLIMNGEMDYNPTGDQPRWTFGGLGNSIEAVAAGTLGEDLSFWGHAILSSEGLELNRIFMTFSNIVGPPYAVNARVGVFEPGLFSFSTHRGWMEGYWLTTRNFDNDPEADPAKGMGWTIEEFQKGIELNGILNGRFGYNVGMVEAFGLPHSDKDFYAHVTYKYDGLPLDGVVRGGSAPNNAQPYIDNSITVGAFAYAGTPKIGSDAASQINSFMMFGGDFNAYFNRLNVFGGLSIRKDDQPFLGSTLPANTTTWFTEVNYVIYPWLLPGIRFESWKSEMLDETSTSTAPYTDVQFVPGVVALVRPNVKVTLRTSIEKFESRGDTGFNLGQVMVMLSFGI